MKGFVERLWHHYKQEFLMLHHQEIGKLSNYKMELAHTDSKGRSYMRFVGKDTDIPIERIGKMQDFMELMGTGLGADELDDLIAVAQNECALAFAGKKANVLNIGVVFDEIQKRRQMILHTELLYNFLAVQYVREDEPINEFVESIHMEKIKQFKEDNKGSSTYFFFQVPELKMVNELLKCSQAEWDQFWAESIKEQTALKRKIDLLNSVKKSVSATRTPATT